MIKKGDYYETLSAVIRLCKSTHNEVPHAIILGPEEYSDYELEIGGHLIMGQQIKATKTTIHGIPIMITPSPGIDFAFNVSMKDKLMEHLIALRTSEEAAEKEQTS